MSGQLQDMKEALGSAAKPDVTHVRFSTMVYVARASEYGSAKYQRANYARPVKTPADDFRRLRAYTRAAVAHLVKLLDEMEHHEAGDPELADCEGMKRAAYAADTEAGASFSASGLPHLAHAAASLNMAIEQATSCGLLPADPGQPWARAEQPEAPAADYRVVSRSGKFEVVAHPNGRGEWLVRYAVGIPWIGVWRDRQKALAHLDEIDAKYRARVADQ